MQLKFIIIQPQIKSNKSHSQFCQYSWPQFIIICSFKIAESNFQVLIKIKNQILYQNLEKSMSSILSSLNFQNIDKQFKDLVSLFKENKFEIVQQLTDALFDYGYNDNYSYISSILISLLIKECSQDSFMLQKIFNSILTNYITSDSSLKHLQTLYVLATYFNQQVIIQGDELIRYIIQKDSEQCLRVLTFLSTILKKRENQEESFDFIVQQKNIKQPSLVKIQEPSRLIDELIKISNDDQIQEQKQEVNALAINCLLFLHKYMSKAQLSMVMVIFYNNLYQIEIICQYKFDIVCQYLYILIQNQVQFTTVYAHGMLLKLIINLNDSYFQNVNINCGVIELNTKKEIYLILEDKRLEQIKNLYDKINQFTEQILNLENNFEEKYLVKQVFEAKDQYFELYSILCVEIAEAILADTFLQFAKKYKNMYIQLAIQVCKLKFFEVLSTNDKFLTNYEIDYRINQIIDIVLNGINENKIIDYIYKELNNIEKRCSVIKKSQVLSKNQEVDTSYSQKLIQEDILVVNKSDKFQVIGCFKIMRYILNKDVELKEIDMFFKFFSYMFFDSFLQYHAIKSSQSFVVICKQYITLHHYQFIPQLIEVFKINDSQLRIFALSVFIYIFQNLQKSDQAQLYPYTKDILHILIKEYTNENFQKHSALLSQKTQKFIKQLLELEDIYLYLEDEIQIIENLFLEMIVNNEKRELLIQSNQQICLCAILKIKQMLKLDCSELKQNIKAIAEEIAQKIQNSSNQISTTQKTFYYQFFQVLTVEMLGSQNCFDQVFLQVLPSALKDGSVKNCPIIIKSREHLTDQQREESDNNSEEVEENQNHQNQQADNEEDEYSDDEEEEEQDEQSNEEEEQVNEEDEYEDIDDEQDDEESIEYDILRPSLPQQILVEEALHFILIFCKESTETFINYKKFDIFNLLSQNLQNELIFEESVHSIMNTILQIISVTQLYFLKKHQEEIKQQGNSQILEQGAIEIFQMYQLTVYQALKLEKNRSEDYKQSLTKVVQEIIKLLDKQIIAILYQQLYESIMRTIFQLARQDKISIINGVQLLANLYEKLPDKMIEGIKMSQSAIQKLLRHESVDQDTIFYQEIYKDKIIRLPTSADFECVKYCLQRFYIFIDINPQVYPIISQIYYDVISGKINYGDQVICFAVFSFLIKIARYCIDQITPKQISLISNFLKQFEAENSNFSIAMIASIIAKAMISLQQIQGLNLTHKQMNINFQKFLQILPEITDISKYEDVKYIIEQIKKSNYNFSAQENDNIHKFLLRVQVI
ncbi:hypothetical protein TTHERM_00241910 (macronuclear) [Tetrahymena thermophila SB210]|uniref:Uncharacterized protein n=1 Tax=Tetrahymena thermophila (strain SB210) TaxID=312017 RepID=I7MIR0_TETTS|nr:hypothetical protein TTHERM_00241910 [Tetrahymena thermophila SB210]EAS04670.2 hypothetical protein TTHERM_00241910 [Tetrahymena thermophila SB210]|eukprot:XP_001024915.2 hypothetical protein TTHERM_00241910 [Tetrahymena thermophila SB210]